MLAESPPETEKRNENNIVKRTHTLSRENIEEGSSGNSSSGTEHVPNKNMGK